MGEKAKAGIFFYRHEAELARSALEAEGIISTITCDDAGGFSVGIQFTNGAHLWVAEEDLPRAKEILDGIEE
jgi:Putative prokaryotic signal transducing protein